MIDRCTKNKDAIKGNVLIQNDNFTAYSEKQLHA